MDSQDNKPLSSVVITQDMIVPGAIKPRHLQPQPLNKGDLYYSDGTDFKRLAIGTSAQLLKVVSGIPAWATVTIPVVVVPDTVKVYNSANQSINSATDTVLTFDTNIWDSNSLHSATKLICKTAGKYLVSAFIQWQASDTGVRQAYFMVNGSAQKGNILISASASNPEYNLVDVIKLAVSDYVELYVKQNSGGALNVNGGDETTQSFGMTYIAP